MTKKSKQCARLELLKAQLAVLEQRLEKVSGKSRLLEG